MASNGAASEPPRFRRRAVLDEGEIAAGFQNAPHFGQRRERIRDRTQRPGHHDRIEACVSEGEAFGGSSQQPYRDSRILHPFPCQSEELHRGTERADPGDRGTVERQIEARPRSRARSDARTRSCAGDEDLAVGSASPGR